MTLLRSLVVWALVVLTLRSRLLTGQQAPALSGALAHAITPDGPGAADDYEAVYEQLQKMQPRADRMAIVRSLTLRRDVIEFHLEDGKLYVATPVAGRTVGAVFVGRGSVAFAPPLAVERLELQRVLGDSVITSRIMSVAFLFTDSTLAELERQLSFGPASGGIGDAAGPLHDALDHLVDGRAHEVGQPTLMAALLNGDVTGFFYGHVKRERGEDLMFLVDPQEAEQIELLRGGHQSGQRVQIVSQFKRAEDLRDSTVAGNEAHEALTLESCRIEATITNDLGFAAVATARVTARRAGVRWARFLLYEALNVDSLRDEAGAADSFYRAKHSPELWVRFDAPLPAGATRVVRIVYHGDLIGSGSVMNQIESRWIQGWTDSLRRRGMRPDSVRAWESELRRRLPPATDKWLFVKQSETWFPRYAPAHLRYADAPAAEMELTFHTPARYRFAAIGRLVESRVHGDVATTRWVTELPAGEVCFNLGDFYEFKITDPRIPPVTVQVNAEAHHRLAQLLLGQRDPEKDVGADVANSLGFFTRAFGPPLFTQYYATEIPFFYGQAFPGLMYLSMATFQTVNESGREEAFRAHEMAHQWWGIGVQPASYRDIWISEGFADFSGWWYTQRVLMDNDKVFKELRERRQAIRARRGAAPPIGLGWRVSQTDVPADYSLVIYKKGAWVLQMLRNLMIDFRTMKEDAFTATMQDFYQQYRGRPASTDDFRRVVEHHIGIPMDWFFDEWVNGTAIPTYLLSWHAEPTQDGHYLLRLRVRQEDVPPTFVMRVPLRIAVADGEVFVRVNVSGPMTEATLNLPAEPKQLELNPLESVLADVKTEGWH
ncbi:MAG TPA: M1 family aminopeptidase [Gemmatimonadales bacterium]|nr:M1 family aminopeptidase [Gemmatimonadales bacterium]